MKNRILLLLLFLSSCVAGKKASSNPDKALAVSFYSIGSGIDYKTKTALDKYIEQCRTTLSVSIVRSGKEGEQDYCIDLKPLPSTEQTKFISGVKQLLNEGKWIKITEKENCK